MGITVDNILCMWADAYTEKRDFTKLILVDIFVRRTAGYDLVAPLLIDHYVYKKDIDESKLETFKNTLKNRLDNEKPVFSNTRTRPSSDIELSQIKQLETLKNEPGRAVFIINKMLIDIYKKGAHS